MKNIAILAFAIYSLSMCFAVPPQSKTGGHVAVQESVLAQFGSTVRAFRSFGRIRRARNSFEYPSTVAPGPSAEDVTDAITAATQAHQAATTILEKGLLTAW